MTHIGANSARAADYDSEEYLQKINTQIVTALRSRLGWIGAPWVDVKDDKDKVIEGEEGKRECKLLDYACGTGKITRVCTSFPFPLPPLLLRQAHLLSQAKKRHISQLKGYTNEVENDPKR